MFKKFTRVRSYYAPRWAGQRAAFLAARDAANAAAHAYTWAWMNDLKYFQRGVKKMFNVQDVRVPPQFRTDGTLTGEPDDFAA